MREVINHSTCIHLLNTIKYILTQTLEKTLYKESLWQVDFNRIGCEREWGQKRWMLQNEKGSRKERIYV